MFARKFSFFVSEIDRMDVLFEANFSTVSTHLFTYRWYVTLKYRNRFF